MHSFGGVREVRGSVLASEQCVYEVEREIDRERNREREREGERRHTNVTLLKAVPGQCTVHHREG